MTLCERINRTPDTKILSTSLESGKIVRAHAVFTGHIINDGPNNDGGRNLLYIYLLDIVEDH